VTVQWRTAAAGLGAHGVEGGKREERGGGTREEKEERRVRVRGRLKRNEGEQENVGAALGRDHGVVTPCAAGGGRRQGCVDAYRFGWAGLDQNEKEGREREREREGWAEPGWADSG
jgi:hypothetical protein